MGEYGEPVFGTVRDEAPVARIPQGAVRGFSRDGIALFKGIPYAGDCGGEGRFLPPGPVPSWSGIRDCTKNGPYAMQNGVSIGADEGAFAAYYRGRNPRSTGEIERQGENCLVLDVLTPGLDDKKRPVVFYIHGGGFQTGSGTMVAAADAWCREQDLVLVGVNHRLNIFGYLDLSGFDEKYADSGCVGMLDLIQALRWVRASIASFGGDPDNVTLVGESGGGAKISTLLTMPAARGLFQKAVVESGSTPIGHYTREDSAKVTDRILRRLGIAPKDWKVLLSLPADQLLGAIREERGFTSLTPVADGRNLPDQTASGFVHGIPDFSREISVIVGAGEDELAMAAPRPENLSFADLAPKLAREGVAGPDESIRVSAEQAEKIVETFCRNNTKQDDPAHTWMKILSMTSSIGRGAFHQAMERVSCSRITAPVYHYVNTYDSAHPLDPAHAYSFHTCDLPLQMRIVQRPQDEEISRVYAASLAAFARTGDPSTKTLSWPAFTPGDRRTMIFDNGGRTRVEQDPQSELREVIEAIR